MKARLRIATKDQFCFIEADCEGDPNEIVAEYGALYKAYWSRGGIEPKQFQGILDGYIWHNRPFSEQEYNAMSEEQKWLVNEIKKSKNRAKYQVDKENREHAKVINKLAKEN